MKKIPGFIKRHKRLSVISAVILLVALAFMFRPQPPKQITTETVQKTTLVQSISVNGNVNSDKIANLNFLTGGKLVFLGAKKGDFVNAFQTIGVLDQSTVQKNLEIALIDYLKQRNDFEQTKDNNFDRQPQDALTDAAKRILEDNQYDLEKAVKSVELQDLAKQQSVITTPISGIVTRADAQNAGVNVGSTTTFTIVDPNTMTFEMDVDEADIGKVIVGQPVDIVLDPYPDQTLHLIVENIDFTTHTTTTGSDVYTVKARLGENVNYQYRIGMNGSADIITAKKEGVLVIQTSSIFDENYVYVKTQKGFLKRKIIIGIQNDTQTQVISGLNEGETIATQPSQVPPPSAQSAFPLRLFRRR